MPNLTAGIIRVIVTQTGIKSIFGIKCSNNGAEIAVQLQSIGFDTSGHDRNTGEIFVKNSLVVFDSIIAGMKRRNITFDGPRQITGNSQFTVSTNRAVVSQSLRSSRNIGRCCIKNGRSIHPVK